MLPAPWQSRPQPPARADSRNDLGGRNSPPDRFGPLADFADLSVDFGILARTNFPPHLLPSIEIEVCQRMSTSTMSEAADETKPIQLQVKIESPQPCLREVVVTIPQAEVQRYMKNAYDEIVPEAQVPGISRRSRTSAIGRKTVQGPGDRSGQRLSLDGQPCRKSPRAKISRAISEPDFDYNSIVLPEDGDFKFQFSVEVRPEFETPNWKGLKFTKPVENIGDDEVTESLNRVLCEIRNARSDRRSQPRWVTACCSPRPSRTTARLFRPWTKNESLSRRASAFPTRRAQILAS